VSGLRRISATSSFLPSGDCRAHPARPRRPADCPPSLMRWSTRPQIAYERQGILAEPARDRTGRAKECLSDADLRARRRTREQSRRADQDVCFRRPRARRASGRVGTQRRRGEPWTRDACTPRRRRLRTPISTPTTTPCSCRVSDREIGSSTSAPGARRGRRQPRGATVCCCDARWITSANRLDCQRFGVSAAPDSQLFSDLIHICRLPRRPRRSSSRNRSVPHWPPPTRRVETKEHLAGGPRQPPCCHRRGGVVAAQGMQKLLRPLVWIIGVGLGPDHRGLRDAPPPIPVARSL